MQVSKLVATATVFHRRPLLSLKRLFIDDEAVIGDDRANLVFLLFSSDAEHLVVNLDGDKILWKDLRVANRNLCCRLRSQVVNHQLVRRIIEVV